MYFLMRINSEFSKVKVSIIGIFNDFKFKEYLDVCVFFSLSEEEVVFLLYDVN